MKSTLIRALVAIIAGGLMVKYREEMVTWLTISLGVLFFLSGVISIIYYCVASRHAAAAPTPADAGDSRARQKAADKPTFPIVGIGCAVLGIILALMPATFVTYLVYVFAAIIIVGAIGEYMSIVAVKSALRRYENETGAAIGVRCGVRYWLLPTLLLLFGIVALLRPSAIASAPFLFVGIALVVYGLSAFVNAFKIRSMRRAMRREQVVALVRTDDEITDAVIVGESAAAEQEQTE